MKVTEQEIARTACELRDEKNSQLHVSPWNRHRRYGASAWITAVSAAAVVGFLLGIWTNAQIQKEEPLTALVDTIYIKVHDASEHTALPQMVNATQSMPIADKPTVKKETSKKKSAATGLSVMNDNIRYDLLTMN